MAAITYEISPGSLRGIGELLSGLKSRFAPALRVAATSEVMAVAEQLNERIKAAFIAGTDKHGESHNKTGWTLGTFHVEPHPFGAFVILGGAADLVYEGSRAHAIDAKADGWLTFESPSHGWSKVKHVNSPGYKGDRQFVDGPIAESDLGAFAARVVGAAYASMFLRAAGH